MSNTYRLVLRYSTGGFALAARWAGIKTVQFVEIDPFCQKVLKKNFPGVPIHDDIKTFTYTEHNGSPSTNGEGTAVESQKQNGEDSIRELARGSSLQNGRHFLLTGGFPCQPFSCAGKRRGKEDDRYLWEEMLRVIKEFKPTWIIGENVNGIRSMEFQDGVSELEGDTVVQEDGNGDYTNVLDGICDSLEAIGYEVQPVIIPACAVNAPHRRDRVWIVGYSKSSSKREIGSVCKRESSDTTRGVESDCHAPDTSNQGLQGGEETRNTSVDRNESRNELLGGCPSWEEPWLEVAQRFCKLDAGLPSGLVGYLGITEEHLKHRDEHRVQKLKALGNAVVPQIPYLIMKAILEAENVHQNP